MIIKELRIGSFAGIEDRTIKFQEGMNIIYGTNEAGKSRIETFIKVMLYGFSNKRVKGESERKKYISFNKDTAYGEMIISHKDKDYLIKRKFGSSKKYDSSEIFDYLTGEKVQYVNSNEPGKYFLQINRSTFEKTLYISQLAVAFSKDKEEEIMDKVTAVFGCGEHEVSAEKAILKLESLRKTYVTSRGMGLLGVLNKKYNELQEERYEGKISAENNLEWEKELIDRKNDKDRIYKEIEDLEVYKKYLKKIELQKEYKEIIKYFKESEGLKSEEKEIIKNISKDGKIIDEELLDDILRDNSEYLREVDDRNEKKQGLDDLYRTLKDKEIELERYKFIELFGDNLKEKLLEIKYEQQGLEEKINISKEIKRSIEVEENDIKRKENYFLNLIGKEELVEKIIDNLTSYESKLKELKKTAYSEEVYLRVEKERNNKRFKIILGSLFIVLGTIIFFIKGIGLLISLIFIIVGVSSIYLGIVSFDKSEKTSKRNIERLTNDIKNIEEFLSFSRNELKLENNESLIKYINKYRMFKKYREKTLIRIEEKKRILNSNNYEEIFNKFNKNNEMIKHLIRVSGCKNISEAIECIDNYSKIKSEIDVINEKILYIEKSLQSLNINIQKKEYLLKNKVKDMGICGVELLELDVVINEYRIKVRKLKELDSNLKAIEKTYSALIKDRDINEIREELKDIINNSDYCSYETEEEIDKEEKLKSKELIQCEKDIKDIENKINSRLIGKRSLVQIEEEIKNVLDQINKCKKELSSVDLAIETLKESMNEVRRTVGPKLNKSVSEMFACLTKNKYEEIKVDNNYEMLVRSKNSIFKGNYLSNGTYDQLYLSLRIALIELLFKEEKCSLILDDAFVQYDDKRREEALMLINEKINGQILIFTCHTTEESIMLKNNVNMNYIRI